MKKSIKMLAFFLAVFLAAWFVPWRFGTAFGLIPTSETNPASFLFGFLAALVACVLTGMAFES